MLFIKWEGWVGWFDEEAGMECSDLIRYEAAAESKPPTTFISNRTFVHSMYILLSSFSEFATDGTEGGSRVVYITTRVQHPILLRLLLPSSLESIQQPSSRPAACDLSIYLRMYVCISLASTRINTVPQTAFILQAVSS